MELGLDVSDHVVHRLDADRALLTRLEDGVAQLGPVERLPPPVPLDDHGEDVLDVLVGGVAAVALQALAPPANELPVPPDP